MYASLDCRERNYRPYLVSSARNIVSKCSLCANLTRFRGVFCRQTGQSFLPCLLLQHRRTENFRNSIKSRSNSPGWEKMTPLNVQENLFGKQPIHLTTLMSSPALYISTRVLHTNSHITLARPVLTREPARRLTLSKPIFPRQSMNSRTTIDPVHF